MLFAMVKGTDSSKVNAEPSKDVSTEPMGDWRNEMESWQREDRSSASPERNLGANNKAETKDSDFLLSATSFSPNILGLKGLNHDIGEWVYIERQPKSSGGAPKANRYAVIGGVEGAPTDNSSLPTVVERFPWEGFEEIGFRTVKSASVVKSAG